MQNQEIIQIIENLKGRRNYEEKKASKLGFTSLPRRVDDLRICHSIPPISIIRIPPVALLLHPVEVVVIIAITARSPPGTTAEGVESGVLPNFGLARHEWTEWAVFETHRLSGAFENTKKLCARGIRHTHPTAVVLLFIHRRRRANLF